MNDKQKYTVALAGNPNVGKSTVFNALTGLRQHTGNWPGKTVERAVGTFDISAGRVELVDVPGTYSLEAKSPEEAVTAEYIKGESGESPDGVIVVCDACCLERSLAFLMQVSSVSRRVLVCINLMDEAARRGTAVDTEKLENLLGIPVVPVSARRGVGLDELKMRLGECLAGDEVSHFECRYTPSELVSECVEQTGDPFHRDRGLDRIFTGKYTALPISAVLLALVFFITLKGASPISDGLSYALGIVEAWVRAALVSANAPSVLVSMICDGVLRVLFWVVAVMLPPMAIFFPLFTLIEDFGYLPRVAYNFDGCFRCCGACGKQSLTMMMGLGCNAVGVTGARIIDSPRERLIAILTNSFIPCNGRLPVLAVFFAVLTGRGVSVGEGFLMCAAVSAGCVMTLFVSKVLSESLLRGETSAFAIELPPYRIPRVGQVIVRSVIDRTLHVLGRAAAVAAPAGMIIWCMGNVTLGGENLMAHAAGGLDPVGKAIGMDGVMLLAFFLALPAGEITVPLMLMGYSATSALTPVGSLAEAAEMLSRYGWGTVNAVCAAIFTVFHFPCSTTLITVYRETGKVRWVLAAAAIPTIIGALLCAGVNLLFH